MIKSRLNKIEKMLKGDIKNYRLMAFERPGCPDKNIYTIWDGIPGSGNRVVTKKEWEATAQKVTNGSVVKFIDDIAGYTNENKK